MSNLPHRYILSSLKFSDSVHLVAQTGHDAAIEDIAFCPLKAHIATLDADRWLKVWRLESLEVVYVQKVAQTGAIDWLDAQSLAIKPREGAPEVLRLTSEPADADIAQKERASTEASGYVFELLSALEVTLTHEHVEVRAGDHTYTYPMDAPRQFAIDGMERYIVVVSDASVHLIEAHHGECLYRLDAPAGDSWCDFDLNAQGDRLLLFTREGTLYALDPMRPEPRLIYQLGGSYTMHSIAGDTLLGYGNTDGNVAVVDLVHERLLFKTPRKLPPFNFVMPSPRRTGFLALREESVAAYLHHSQEVQPASPLPAPLVCASPGELYTELIVSLVDNHVYRLKMDSNDIERICSYPQVPSHIAYKGGQVIAHIPQLGYMLFDGEQNIKLKLSPNQTLMSMALSEQGKYFASIYEHEHVRIYHIAQHEAVAELSLKGAKSMFFGPDKYAHLLYILDADLVLWCYDLQNHQISQFADLSEVTPRARPIVISPGDRQSMYILLESAQEHYVTLRVNLGNGRAQESMRILTIGQHIVGAYINHKQLFIQENNHSVRIIQNFESFTARDWIRSEPLAIF